MIDWCRFSPASSEFLLRESPSNSITHIPRKLLVGDVGGDLLREDHKSLSAFDRMICVIRKHHRISVPVPEIPHVEQIMISGSRISRSQKRHCSQPNWYELISIKFRLEKTEKVYYS